MQACETSLILSAPVALALKGIDYEYKSVHLLQDGGQQVRVINSPWMIKFL